MTDPLAPPPLTFEQLRRLAWIRIPRGEALYASEDLVMESIDRATDELHPIFTSMFPERLISREDALVLELVTVLERCRPARGHRSANHGGSVRDEEGLSAGSRVGSGEDAPERRLHSIAARRCLTNEDSCWSFVLGYGSI